MLYVIIAIIIGIVIIGLTVVAVETSLPKFISSIAAAHKGGAATLDASKVYFLGSIHGLHHVSNC